MSALPRVLMVFTGGTISMQVVPGRGAVPARSGREILALVPRMADTASIVLDDFDRIPGPHWTPERMLDLARHLRSRLAGEAFAGAVVTHGTDTLEETAYLLDLVLDTGLPVVLTGAMKTADDPSWDGPANLVAAARCAASDRSRGLGVLVVFDDTVHAAAGVTKVHTEAFGAFKSPRYGPLGEMEADGPRYGRVPARPRPIPIDRVESRVALVAAAAGVDARPLLHALDDGARGIVVEALGRGNVPPSMVAGVREATARGVPVVIASRCPGGRTAARYGYQGGGVELEEAGALFAGDLSASKARIKLMVLLGAGREGDAVRASFST